MAVLIAISSFVGIVLIGSTIFFHVAYTADKRKVCSSATVEYFDGKGSIVKLWDLTGFTLYYIEKKLKVGSEIKILDFERIKEFKVKENFYLALHRLKISRLSKKMHRLTEGIYCLSDSSSRAKMVRILDNQKCLCADVDTGELVVISHVPRITQITKSEIFRYDRLVLTDPIKVTEVVSE